MPKNWLYSTSPRTIFYSKHFPFHFTELGDDYLVAKMPVNERVYQPDGVLHGGATFALAETVGSVASIFLQKMSIKLFGY